MAIKFTNNAATTLAAGITNVETSLTVATSSGALFPAITSPDYTYVTIINANTPTVFEIVKVTARSGDVFTITRAQEGTTAQAWATGDKVELRLTAGGLAEALIGTATYTRTTATATASQTTFSVAYTAPFILVYVNGVFLPAADYTAVNGTSVVLAVGCAAGDIVEFVRFAAVNVSNTMQPDFSNATAVNPIATGGTGQSTIAGARGAIGIGVASRKTAAYTAVAGDYLACDTIAVGAFTVTLPATPVVGDKPIVIFDAGTTATVNGFATNNLTVGRNGNTIHGLSEDAIISTKGICVTFEYINATWRVRLG